MDNEIDKESLIQDVLDLQEQGYSYQQIADNLDISKSKVSRIITKINETEQNETDDNGTFQRNETVQRNEIRRVSEQKNETERNNETEESLKNEIENLKNQIKFKESMKFTLPIPEPKDFYTPPKTERNETKQPKYEKPIVPTETELQDFYNDIVTYVENKNETPIYLSDLKKLIENVENYITQAGVYACEMEVDEDEFDEVKALQRLLEKCLNPLIENNPQRKMDFECDESIINELLEAYQDTDE